MRKAGAGYVVLLYTALSAPAYARSHPHLDPALLAAYSSAWPLALESAVVIAGVMLAVIPLHRGERWALWTEIAMMIIMLVTRLTTDPRCLVVLDPHQHGCHSFMIAVILGVVGLGLASR
jgi:hypothetical protein